MLINPPGLASLDYRGGHVKSLNYNLFLRLCLANNFLCILANKCFNLSFFWGLKVAILKSSIFCFLNLCVAYAGTTFFSIRCIAWKKKRKREKKVKQERERCENDPRKGQGKTESGNYSLGVRSFSAPPSLAVHNGPMGERPLRGKSGMPGSRTRCGSRRLSAPDRAQPQQHNTPPRIRRGPEIE